MMGTCKLCGLDKGLVNSHIIPEFMYKYLFDEKHKFFQTNSDHLKKGELKSKKRNTGAYAPGILCSNCDNHVIGKYESYASKVIYGENVTPSIAPTLEQFYNSKGEEWSICSNIDYTKFKLFLLSILWRASITSGDSFNEVKIGRHEDKIREMIWKGDAGEDSDYPIIFMSTVNDKSIPVDFIVQPRTFKFDGHHTIIFPITGMLYIYFVSSHSKPKKVLNNTLKKNNTMLIEHIPIGRGWEFILKHLRIM